MSLNIAARTPVNAVSTFTCVIIFNRGDGILSIGTLHACFKAQVTVGRGSIGVLFLLVTPNKNSLIDFAPYGRT